MLLIVAIVGSVFLVAGIAIFLFPARLQSLLATLLRGEWIGYASVIRVGLGVLFIFAAPETRAPSFVMAVGILFLVAGVALPLIGTFRVTQLGNWWLERPVGVVRAWALLAGTLGAAIVWAAV